MSTLVKQASRSRTQRPRCVHLVFDHGVLVMLLTMFFALFSLAQENASGTVLAGVALAGSSAADRLSEARS